MTFSFKGPIKWKERLYHGAEKLGFTHDGRFIISLYTYNVSNNHKGNYFTVFPISDDTFRKYNPTKAAVRDDGDAITLFCDFGHSQRIEAPRSVIEALIAEAKVHKIPVLPNLSGEENKGKLK